MRRALNGRAVHPVVRRRIHRAVTRVPRRVVDAPPFQQRAVGQPSLTVVVAPEQEQTLAAADQCQDSDGTPQSAEPNQLAGASPIRSSRFWRFVNIATLVATQATTHPTIDRLA